MSRIRADKLVNRAGTGAPELPFGLNAPGGLNVTGIVTATSFSGPVTGNVTGNADTATSATTATTAGALGSGATGSDLTLSGNLTVNGTTTTIDTAVTAVDSLAVDGNVGIGTTNATSILDVRNGTIVKDQDTTQNAANPGLQLKHNGTINGSWRHDGRLEIGGQDADAEITLNSNGSVEFAGTIWGGTTDGGVTATTSFASRLYNNSAFPTLYAKNSGNGGLWQGVNSSGTETSKINSDGSAEFAATISDSIGPLRRLGVNSQSGAYTLVVADAGKAVTQSTNSAAVTVPASTFTAGDMVTVINNTGTNINLTQGSGLTMYNTADAATGTRTLAQRGAATLLFTSASVAYVSGSGLS